MTDTDVITKIKTKTDVKEPSMYHVIFLDDDGTFIEFVVQMLVEHFGFTSESAMDKIDEIHKNGRGVVGTYTYEIADQKAFTVVKTARMNNFPLEVKVEEVE